MNKDIINPSKKTITYAATLSSVVSLLPVEEPDVPYLNRSNGIVSITTTPRKGQWAYGKIPRLFLLYAQTLIKEVSPMVDFENRTIHLDETFNSFCKNTGIAANGQREQVTRMLENLGSTVFQVTNWFKDEQAELSMMPSMFWWPTALTSASTEIPTNTRKVRIFDSPNLCGESSTRIPFL